MTELHLEPRHLVMIEKMLQDFIPEARVWCFGSWVHGRGLKRFSDLDLVVRNEKNLHAQQENCGMPLKHPICPSGWICPNGISFRIG